MAASSGVPPSAPALVERLRSAALVGALSATLALTPICPTAMEAQAQPLINDDTPVVDLARVVPAAKLDGLQQQLKDLER